MRNPAILILTLLGACASTPPPDSNKMKPEHAPTPFSADQIREGCPDGRMLVFLIEKPLEDSILRTVLFSEGTQEEARFEFSIKSIGGKTIQSPSPASAPWTALQSHASFPESETVITSEEVRTPAGRFDCWLYTVTSEREGRSHVKRLYFAKKLPGPPVRMTEAVDGTLAATMTLIEHTPGG